MLPRQPRWADSMVLCLLFSAGKYLFLFSLFSVNPKNSRAIYAVCEVTFFSGREILGGAEKELLDTRCMELNNTDVNIF